MRLPLVLMLAVAACGPSGDGDGSGGDDAPEPPTVFDPSIRRVIVEIDFEDGEQPYTGPILGFGDTMDVTVTNIDRLFASKKTLAIPRTVPEMENIGDIADEELTSSDLLALATTHRSQRDDATTKTYYVMFVSGHFADGSGARPTVLGVSLGGSGVIAMFKDVIRSTNVPGFPNVVRFVEQSTLVHELAHAIGLVDNGVEPTVDHTDTEHGAHCTNDRCVMYYLNEGASDATDFARMYVVAGDSILFDDACLGDVDALTGGP